MGLQGGAADGGGECLPRVVVRLGLQIRRPESEVKSPPLRLRSGQALSLQKAETQGRAPSIYSCGVGRITWAPVEWQASITCTTSATGSCASAFSNTTFSG